MNTITLTIALAATAAATLSYANRAGRAEAALRRIVETQAAAMNANAEAPQDEYERRANERDDAIDAAAAVLSEGR